MFDNHFWLMWNKSTEQFDIETKAIPHKPTYAQPAGLISLSFPFESNKRRRRTEEKAPALERIIHFENVQNDIMLIY